MAELDPVLMQGLKELSASAFPKRCKTCGRRFETAADYVRETERINPERSGLKQSTDDDGSHIVEMFRNCPCGSTLMDVFADRRNSTATGLARRARFGALLRYLETRGIAAQLARSELLKALRGEPSEVLRNIPPPPRS